MSDLVPRLLSAVVMICLALGALWLGGRWFVAFWLVAAAAVFWEWLGIIGSQRRLVTALFGAGVLALAAALASNAGAEFALLAVLVGAVGVGVLERKGLPGWAFSGLLYAGVLIVSVTSLRMSVYPVHALNSILWLFAVVWGTDILAYFGGRLIGGPKLWPAISPSKTWSGFLTGVIGGALAGTFVLFSQTPPSQRSIFTFMVLGLLAAAVSQAGDFFESAVKRRFGVKDASNLIPGHGGFMDRLDGFIAASAFAAFLGLLRGGPANPATGLLVW